jgi:hypothetical protein
LALTNQHNKKINLQKYKKILLLMLFLFFYDTKMSKIIMLFVALSLTGCANLAANMQRQHNVSQMSGMRIGMTERQVLDHWGSPTRLRKSAYGEVWIYRKYIGRILGTETRYVQFNNKGRVINWSGLQ